MAIGFARASHRAMKQLAVFGHIAKGSYYGLRKTMVRDGKIPGRHATEMPDPGRQAVGSGDGITGDGYSKIEEKAERPRCQHPR